ncbi:unnamed protein product [Cunninghamella echinulata]
MESEKVSLWLKENGWSHFVEIFENQGIRGEQFFRITLAELVKLLPRPITYAERRRLLNDIRTLTSTNKDNTTPTNISINTDIHLLSTNSNISSSSLQSIGTPNSTSYIINHHSPTTSIDSSSSNIMLDQPYYSSSTSSTSSPISSDIPSTTTTTATTTNNNTPTIITKTKPSSRKSSTSSKNYSPKNALTKIKNTFFSLNNNTNNNYNYNNNISTTSSPSSPLMKNKDKNESRRKRYQQQPIPPINTNFMNEFNNKIFISPRTSSRYYDTNLLLMDDYYTRPSSSPPSIPTRISSTPDKINKFWASCSYWHQGDNNNNHLHHLMHKNPAVSSNNKKHEQKIQVTLDKETWYSLNVKDIRHVHQLKDHILKRMNLKGDRDSYCYFHENGHDPDIPLDSHALMYLCSMADHSATDRILVIPHKYRSESAIYNFSSHALSTPELGHSPSDITRSSYGSIYANDTLQKRSRRIRPLCRHVASASRLRLDTPVIGIRLSDPPLSISSSSSTSPSTTQYPSQQEQHNNNNNNYNNSNYNNDNNGNNSSGSSSSSSHHTFLWAVPPKESSSPSIHNNNTIVDPIMDTYELIHPMTPISANSTTSNRYSFPSSLPIQTTPSPPSSALPSKTTFDDIQPHSDDPQQSFWGERPPAEVVFQNMEKYFDDHDLDKEVVVTTDSPTSLSSFSSTTTPTSSSSLCSFSSSKLATPTCTGSVSGRSASFYGQGHSHLRRHTKSIRLVAREASRKYLQKKSTSSTTISTISSFSPKLKPSCSSPTSTTFPSSTSFSSSLSSSSSLTSKSINPDLDECIPKKDHPYSMMRRKSTKLWGQRVIEVKPEKRQPHPPLPATSSTTTPTIDYSLEHMNMTHHHDHHQQDPTLTTANDVQWIRGKLIGKGSFGRVYLAFNVVSGEVIAVKQVEIPRTKSDRTKIHRHDMVDALYREIAMLRDLDHENIVQYLGYGVDESEGMINIFLEYVSGGNIASRLSLQGAFDEPLIQYFTRQVCQGLSYLHSRHILHRDIKAANILVEADGVCKISDFGLSKKNDYDEVYDQNSRMSLRGSVYWMAPEMVKNEPYSAKVDIWSLGCTVIEMFTGQRPWMTFTQVAALYNLGHRNTPEMPQHASDTAKDFLKKCFTM